MKEKNDNRTARLMRNILILVALAALFGVMVHNCRQVQECFNPQPPQPRVKVERDTFVAHDTVTVRIPLPVETLLKGDTAIMLPSAAIRPSFTDNAPDSAIVQLPVVTRHYADSLSDGNGYEAWVSGAVDPRLDSLRIYPRSLVVKETTHIREPPPRWGLSVGAGIVATPTRIEPGVFVGVTYTFFPF